MNRNLIIFITSLFIITTMMSMSAAGALADDLDGWCNGGSGNALHCFAPQPTDQLETRTETWTAQALRSRSRGYGLTPTALGCTTVWGSQAAFDAASGSNDCVRVTVAALMRTYSRFHAYRDDRPYVVASKGFYVYPDGSEVDISATGEGTVTIDERYDTPRCPVRSGDGYTYEGSPNPKLPADDPALIESVCYAGTQEVVTDPATLVASQPAKAAACPSIAVGRARAAVSSVGASCAAARTVLTRYAAQGRKAAGWTCRTARSGRARTATCTAGGKAARRVVARWRV